MKKLFLAGIATLALSASAHTILGTQVLKGSLKTKVLVNGVNSTCKVQVEKVRNLLLEDSYGNPAYKVRLDISLKGDNMERNISVRYNNLVWVNNLFEEGTGTIVRDFDYAAADNTKMRIDAAGRIKSVSFIYNKQTVTCSF